jgi:hypothetical protein
LGICQQHRFIDGTPAFATNAGVRYNLEKGEKEDFQMSVLNRYFFYAICFIMIIVGIISQSYTVLGLTFVAGIAIGFITEYYDNRRDEKFKHLNANHQYKH